MENQRVGTGVRRRSAGQISGEDIVIEAAWLYYHDGLNQGQIARALEVSRATVVNYLQEAREKGLIRISLEPGAFTGHRMAVALCKTFGLRAAYVLPDGAGGDEARFLRVARGAADWLPGLLARGDRLGVSWGRTIFEVARALEPHRFDDLQVSQLVGSMATPYGFTSEICSARLAQGLGAKCNNLHAPAVLSDPDLAARLRAEPIIRAQLDALLDCNKSIFAAGSVTPDSHIVSSGLASLEDLAWYRGQGAVGVNCGRFIDARGAPIPGPMDDRMIGIALERLRGLDMGLLVSDGADKVEAMLACIRGGYVTHMATSAGTARAMLALAGS